jgi:hypothetical protein
VQHQRRVAAAAGKWKVFGPTNSYSDGDAEFYRVSNSLAQQYEWFAPRPEEEDAAAADEEGLLEQQDPRKPLYGLTPQQIAALGLSGNRVNTPDPVSGDVGEQHSRRDLAAAVAALGINHPACCSTDMIASSDVCLHIIAHSSIPSLLWVFLVCQQQATQTTDALRSCCPVLLMSSQPIHSCH